jgi:hypothetical protein
MIDVRSISRAGPKHSMSPGNELGHHSIHWHSGKLKLNFQNIREGGRNGEFRKTIQKIKCIKITHILPTW